jgi:hypothetical protein
MKTVSIVIATAILSFVLAAPAAQTWIGANVAYLSSQSRLALQPDANAARPAVAGKRVMLALHCYNSSNPDCD